MQTDHCSVQRRAVMSNCTLESFFSMFPFKTEVRGEGCNK